MDQLWFTGPRQVEILERSLPSLGPGQVLVKTLCSAVSAGTELLLYRGQLPSHMSLDDSLASYADNQIAYPLQYGYANVGRVEQVGASVPESWLGKTVFSFQPHASHYTADPSSLMPLPQGMEPEAAVFLANMETAVNLVQDANPMLGERIVVIGQGVVGLLAVSVLARFPLAELIAVDSSNRRRAWSERLGAGASCDPASPGAMDAMQARLGQTDNLTGSGADVVLEVSGSPAALDLAITLCGYGSRVVVGSWYGLKRSELNLGENFHRNRINIVSSQVSTIAPDLTARWDKARRFSQAWEMIGQSRPQQLITHRLPLAQAAEAYRLLDESTEDVLQVVFTYAD